MLVAATLNLFFNNNKSKTLAIEILNFKRLKFNVLRIYEK